MKKFLAVILVMALTLTMMLIPKDKIVGSNFSVQILKPVDGDFIPVGEDIIVKFKVLNSRETSYTFGYSFSGLSAGSYIPPWSYRAYPSRELSFEIPAEILEKAVEMYGSRVNLYVFEIDQYGYSTGFYRKVPLIVYYGKGELNQLSYRGESDFINTILKSNLKGYIYDIKPTGSWGKEVNYCCNPPKIITRYDYRATIILLSDPYKLDIEFASEFIPPTVVHCILKWPIVYFIR